MFFEMTNKELSPTAAELEVLQILWKESPLTVRTIHDQISKNKDTRYTTTLKIMQLMLKKGLLIRNVNSKKHYYFPVQSEEYIQDNLFDKFLAKTFDGSAQKLVLKALGKHSASQKELDEIQEFINQKKRENERH